MHCNAAYVFGLVLARYKMIWKLQDKSEIRQAIANYLISTQASGATTTDTIHYAETNLKVKAINLLSAVFTPRMYGNGHHASYMA